MKLEVEVEVTAVDVITGGGYDHVIFYTTWESPREEWSKIVDIDIRLPPGHGLPWLEKELELSPSMVEVINTQTGERTLPTKELPSRCSKTSKGFISIPVFV